jgi:RNA polymerase sigma-70 factor (ECF subfamily)
MAATSTSIETTQPQINFGFHTDKHREMENVISDYLPSFHRRAYRYLGNVADAEDAIQDALLSACKHMDQFKGEARMSTWLTAIVINSARMQLRRRPRQIHVSLDEHSEQESYALSELLPDHSPSPEEQCRRSDLAENVVELMAQLSPTLRKAFQLYHFEGMNIREVADTLGVAEGTVKARIARARAKLKTLVRKKMGVKLLRRVAAASPKRTLAKAA